jgi:exosortase C (VPDSG-CTERM-specific)
MDTTIYKEPTVESRLVLRRQLNWLALEVFLLLICFGRPLYDLLKFTAHSDLFSYIPLVPFISAYLIWTERKQITTQVWPCRIGAACAFIAGAGVAAIAWFATRPGSTLEGQDYLSLMTLSFLLFFWGACLALLGSKIMRDAAFPFVFLILAVPMPSAWDQNVRTFLQYASAYAAEMFFKLVGTPVSLVDLQMNLPDFSLIVAPECSGIHSTVVLFITSLLAAHLFLRRAWSRVVLVVAMLPLAILRNGFRIWVIGELCVHVSHKMIDSPIHHRGGPIFFALSLVPFLLLLVYLRKRDFNPSKTDPLPT